MRVLVVDDCDDNALSMAFLLKRFGHEAVVAHGGEAALQQAPLFKPDVLFIDLAMPGVDGFTVARKLRQTSEFAETPLVAVSGYVDACHREQATAAGFTEFLAKPYPLEAVQATMDRIAACVAHIVIEKSGTSNMLSLARRTDADELRQWLKHQRCRVGPVFETAGRFAFFVYTRRPIGDLIGKHGGFQV